jgi:hypothetical protein
MTSWNFTNNTNTRAISGYEDVLDELKTFTKDEYTNENTTNERKNEMIEDVFAIYRGKNIFPITYYNEDGINDEIKKCIEKDVSFDGKVLDLKFNQGQSLCRYLFSNLAVVDAKIANNSMWDRFYDDHKLKRAIDFSLRFKKSVTPTEIRTSLEMIGGNVATNFKTMNAKALYEKYVPKGGTIYDFSAGFGGRMLAALTSKNNYKYLGVEPCVETYNNLLQLGEHIDNVVGIEVDHNMIGKSRWKVFCQGSEDYRHKAGNFVDFAFSSPPYFNLEKYSDEDTQCYNKFPTLDEWFQGYVRQTIKNIYFMLKPNAHYAVNIADFNIGKDKVEFVDKWIQLSVEEGFEPCEKIDMKLQKRVGTGHDNIKQEGIFVFKKIAKES